MASIKSVTIANNDEWDEIYQGCEYATYYHSREWAELWSLSINGKTKLNPLLIIFSDGKKVLIPLLLKKDCKGLIDSYVSSPSGNYGGWISRDEIDIESSKLLINLFRHKYRSIDTKLNLFYRLFITWNPYNNQNNIVCMDGLGEKDETLVLNLENGFDSIYEKWTKGHASAAKKAQHAGVQIRVGKTIEDWKSFDQVFENTLKRLGANSYDHWLIFLNMFNLASPNIKLWLAEYEGKIISGALCFYDKSHVFYGYSGTLSDYFNLRPVNLLIYEIVKNATEKGYKWFDFGASTTKSLSDFKKHFGSEPLPFRRLTFESLWMRLPLRVGRWVRRVLPSNNTLRVELK